MIRRTLIFLAVAAAFFATGQVPSRPEPPRLYNNLSQEFPDFLSADEAARLERKLQDFSNETSNQICVVIVDDLNGMDASSFAFEIGNTWGVGQKDFNNGVVVLVKPTGNAGGRDLFIATGYGLEGAIPDLMTKRVREDHMNPHLRAGRYYEALDEGTTALMQLAKGEYNVKDKRRRGGERVPWPLIVVVIFLVIVFIIRNFFGGGGGTTYSRRGRSIYWGGGFGGFGGGRGFGGGGGFGGFGGGGFGGGGSGGKW